MSSRQEPREDEHRDVRDDDGLDRRRQRPGPKEYDIPDGAG